ncbi:MAG: alkene reductase [Pseudomonadota bacterium]|nr:alkene reductase [Pseudomonadota bacterium]
MSTQPLLTPFDLAGIELRNRIVLAPMTRSRAGAGNVVTELTATYYAQRASAGLLITEATQVAPEGQGYVATPGIYSPEQEAGWRQVVEAVHAVGGVIYAQLWHVGRVSHTSFQPGGKAPVSASGIGLTGLTWTSEGQVPFSTPRALETDEIRGVVSQYVQGARVALAAGFDGVEIHGANGYLIDQFLRDGTNHRTDAYGGSIPNRLRFLLEVVDGVTRVFPASRVGVRLSPGGAFNEMADSDPDALFGAAAEALSIRNLGYLHVIDPAASPKRFTPLLRARFKGAYIVNGGFDAETGNAAIASGEADLVAYGVPFLANPDLPRRFAEGAPLNAPDFATFYTGGEKGYTDYPALP